jgi:hypothetical protein
MKIIGLVILMLGCAAWRVRAVYAGQSVAASPQEASRSAADKAGSHSREADHAAPANAGTRAGKPSDDEQVHRKVSTNKPPASNPTVRGSNHRNEAANSREHSASGDSTNSNRAGTVNSAGAAQNGLARNETINHSPSDRTPSNVRPAAPALSTVRHRGANPAIVGRARNSNSRNTMALDGTHMNRKHTGN